jgi:TolA-binding protein
MKRWEATMSDDVAELLEQLAEDDAPARRPAAERERRSRMTAAMRERLAAPGGKRVPSPPGSISRRGWALVAAAAAVALVVIGALRSQQASTVQLSPERLASPERPQPAKETDQQAPAPAPELPSVSSAQRPSPAKALKPSPSDVPLPSSTAPVAEPSLGAQNELFQSAARASRRGDDASALAELDRLLERHPSSVLAADALVRKFRTLSRLGRQAEARAAASDYLDKYPDGFAAGEARKVVASPAAPAP